MLAKPYNENAKETYAGTRPITLLHPNLIPQQLKRLISSL